ncbi:TrmH family RNA methyltransferase [Schaalia vaccimaxillae]|uniref:TrmH family RNA methyltransferase n=1 Tax=Schaalia vaccimaxillae TaxID=183916 RepID=UPI0003B65A91|nr:TrmH family RNA methyltransferase [Schaalia vaccimaxillae]
MNDQTTPQDAPSPSPSPSSAVGPWPGGPDQWPDDPRYDPELLAGGDARNVEDRYRYWTMDAIRADVAAHSLPFEVAIENLGHDFNIGSIVRTANALGARRVHIVGRRRWNRRGAMVTDRYIEVDHLPDAAALADHCQSEGLTMVGVDNVDGSIPLERAQLPVRACLVFGEESAGLSPQMIASCEVVVAITQRGSTRSMNVGHAAAIAMWAQVQRY